MSIISNIIAINRTINEIVDIFGIDSVEYHMQKKLIEQYITYNPAVPLGITTKSKSGALIISRSNTNLARIDALESDFADAFKNIRRVQKNLGSVRKQASKYYGEHKTAEFVKQNKNEIRAAAKTNFEMSINTDDYYEDYVNLPEDTEAQKERKAEIKRRFQDRGGTHGQEADDIFWDAVNMIKEAQVKNAQEILEDAETNGIGGRKTLSELSGFFRR